MGWRLHADVRENRYTKLLFIPRMENLSVSQLPPKMRPSSTLDDRGAVKRQRTDSLPSPDANENSHQLSIPVSGQSHIPSETPPSTIQVARPALDPNRKPTYRCK